MIILDYKDRRPIYEQVTEKLITLIIRGVLEEGQQLPSVRQMAMDLSINPNTIQRAYGELERQGYIFSVKGKGSFVAENKKAKEKRRAELAARLRTLAAEAKELGISKEELLADTADFYDNRRDEND